MAGRFRKKKKEKDPNAPQMMSMAEYEAECEAMEEQEYTSLTPVHVPPECLRSYVPPIETDDDLVFVGLCEPPKPRWQVYGRMTEREIEAQTYTRNVRVAQANRGCGERVRYPPRPAWMPPNEWDDDYVSPNPQKSVVNANIARAELHPPGNVRNGGSARRGQTDRIYRGSGRGGYPRSVFYGPSDFNNFNDVEHPEQDLEIAGTGGKVAVKSDEKALIGGGEDKTEKHAVGVASLATLKIDDVNTENELDVTQQSEVNETVYYSQDEYDDSVPFAQDRIADLEENPEQDLEYAGTGGEVAENGEEKALLEAALEVDDVNTENELDVTQQSEVNETVYYSQDEYDDPVPFAQNRFADLEENPEQNLEYAGTGGEVVEKGEEKALLDGGEDEPGKHAVGVASLATLKVDDVNTENELDVTQQSEVNETVYYSQDEYDDSVPFAQDRIADLEENPEQNLEYAGTGGEVVEKGEEKALIGGGEDKTEKHAVSVASLATLKVDDVNTENELDVTQQSEVNETVYYSQDEYDDPVPFAQNRFADLEENPEQENELDVTQQSEVNETLYYSQDESAYDTALESNSFFISEYGDVEENGEDNKSSNGVDECASSEEHPSSGQKKKESAV